MTGCDALQVKFVWFLSRVSQRIPTPDNRLVASKRKFIEVQEDKAPEQVGSERLSHTNCNI
jgi:hypothetical protein